VSGRDVSLSAVEEALLAALAPLVVDVVAVSIPGADGDKIAVLLASESQGDDIQQRLRTASIDPALMPAAIFLVDAIPRLGGGKPDYAAAVEIAAGLEVAG
jgi:acyl-[acyl-carrier-protein]-phospholipid O-acyltransferase/long-chain-fatty-acid--[acyl-carrier-protein] ligase